jgi:hypothetical protein
MQSSTGVLDDIKLALWMYWKPFNTQHVHQLVTREMAAIAHRLEHDTARTVDTDGPAQWIKDLTE